MKKFTPYGPGSGPQLLLDDKTAETTYEKLMDGQRVEIDMDGKKIGF